MKFSDIAECLRKHGYTEKETLPHHLVFYEFGTMNFLISDIAKKYEMDYFDGEVEKVVMTQYWFGTTEFKTILTLDELYNSL